MAQIWVHNPGLGEWSALALAGDAFALVPVSREVRVRPDPDGAAGVLILRGREAEREVWVLLAPRGDVLVNGTVPVAGIRVLCDRDEIRLRGAPPVFLSLERPAAVDAMPELGRVAKCMRCDREVVVGSLVVHCPVCGDVYHETEESPCWTLSAQCRTCENPTALDAGPRWSPLEL